MDTHPGTAEFRGRTHMFYFFAIPFTMSRNRWRFQKRFTHRNGAADSTMVSIDFLVKSHGGKQQIQAERDMGHMAIPGKGVLKKFTGYVVFSPS